MHFLYKKCGLRSRNSKNFAAAVCLLILAAVVYMKSKFSTLLSVSQWRRSRNRSLTQAVRIMKQSESQQLIFDPSEISSVINTFSALLNPRTFFPTAVESKHISVELKHCVSLSGFCEFVCCCCLVHYENCFGSKEFLHKT